MPTLLDAIAYGRNTQYLRAEQQNAEGGRVPDGGGDLDILVAGTIFRWHGLKFEGWNTDQLLVSDAPYRGSFDDDFMAKKICCIGVVGFNPAAVECKGDAGQFL